jgi:hypothetical protein
MLKPLPTLLRDDNPLTDESRVSPEASPQEQEEAVKTHRDLHRYLAVE